MNRHVIAAVSDMLFASKIRGMAEHLNVTVDFARTEEGLFDYAKTEVPSLIILDLHETRADPFVAFFSHVETELRRKALEAGVEHVLPRSVFTQRLGEILSGKL